MTAGPAGAGGGATGACAGVGNQGRARLLDLGSEPLASRDADPPASPGELGDDWEHRVHVPVRGQGDEREMAAHVPSLHLIA
jgi:hypothetical protein